MEIVILRAHTAKLATTFSARDLNNFPRISPIRMIRVLLITMGSPEYLAILQRPMTTNAIHMPLGKQNHARNS